MTGYGTFEKSQNGIRITIDLKTLNSRFLEFKFRSPSDLSVFEPRLLKEVKKYFFRGRIEMNVRREQISGSKDKPELDENIVGGYLQSLRRVQKKYHIPGKLDISDLSSLPNVWSGKKQSLPSEKLFQLLMSVGIPCFKKVNHMRQQEGMALKKNILDLVKKFEFILKKVEKKTKLLKGEYEKQLKARLEKLVSSESLDKKRLHQEVAYLVDRSDVSEEVIRLASHFKQFREISNRSGTVGKSLEFLTQEMNREINTIGSKIQHSTITKQVVECKSLLEKIREQIQNVE